MKLVTYCHQLLTKKVTGCLSLRHLVCIMAVLGAIATPHAFAENKKSPSRAPANFIPDDQIEPLPLEQRLWIQEILVEDDAGVLNTTRSNFLHWQEKEEYVRRWNVEPTGDLATPSAEWKRGYLMKQLLKYADKRLSGEIKQAEEGSTFHTVGRVEQALRPDAEAQISKLVSLKLRARVLQGKAILLVNNPWINAHADVKLDGAINVHMDKKIEQLGVHAAVDYDVKNGIYVARLERPLTNEITARFSASQSIDKAPLKSESDSRIELSYSRGF